jgi:hypothetical protein
MHGRSMTTGWRGDCRAVRIGLGILKERSMGGFSTAWGNRARALRSSTNRPPAIARSSFVVCSCCAAVAAVGRVQERTRCSGDAGRRHCQPRRHEWRLRGLVRRRSSACRVPRMVGWQRHDALASSLCRCRKKGARLRGERRCSVSVSSSSSSSSGCSSGCRSRNDRGSSSGRHRGSR